MLCIIGYFIKSENNDEYDDDNNNNENKPKDTWNTKQLNLREVKINTSSAAVHIIYFYIRNNWL